MDRIIVLSGRMASGKTTLMLQLAAQAAFASFSTSSYLKSRFPGVSREDAFRAGVKLDESTQGKWLAEWARLIVAQNYHGRFAIDSARRVDQIDEMRRVFGEAILHIHLTAPDDVLKERFDARAESSSSGPILAWADAQQFEYDDRPLAKIADVVIDTSQQSVEETAIRVLARFDFYRPRIDRCVDVLVGGQYGSEGKGHIAAFIAGEYDVLVRGGGPNAGHQVWEEPKPYCFHHLPSGTKRNRRAKIILAPGATLWVPKLLEELADCDVGPERLSIDPQALIIDPADREFESGSLVSGIGSTGQGVGAAASRKILRTAASVPVRLARDVAELRPFLRETSEQLDNSMRRGDRIFVEGTQGSGLSLHHGFYPHVTSRDTNVSGALSECGIPPTRVRKVVMVCRTFPIRVQSPAGGTSGPMQRELTWDKVAARAGLDTEKLMAAEKTSTTKRQRRVSEFDWELLRRAVIANGPTDIAISFADYLSPLNRDAKRIEQLTEETQAFLRDVELVANAPVSIVSTGFGFQTIIDRRTWAG